MGLGVRQSMEPVGFPKEGTIDMARGGARKGAGRKPGSRNKASMKQAVSKQAIEAGILPVDLMLSVMRDEDLPMNIRLQAAREAAPYVHAKAQPGPENNEPVGYDALKELVMYVNGRTRR